MARPRKENADWFQHYSNFRNKREVSAIRRKYGIEGYGVVVFLFEAIAESNNFQLDISDEFEKDLLSAEIGVELDTLFDIIDFCEKLKLFKRTKKDTQIFLTSEYLNECLSLLTEKRNKERERVSAPETTIPDAETTIPASENPHITVQYSTVKDTVKEKERKEEKSTLSRDARESENFSLNSKNSVKSEVRGFEDTTLEENHSTIEVILPDYEEFRNMIGEKKYDDTINVCIDLMTKHGGTFDVRTIFDIYTALRKDRSLEGRFRSFLKKYDSGELTHKPQPSRLLKTVMAHQFDSKAFNPTASTTGVPTKRGFND